MFATQGGRDCLLADAGHDKVWTADGARDLVRCGPGRDLAIVDRNDRTRGCERVVTRRYLH